MRHKLFRAFLPVIVFIAFQFAAGIPLAIMQAMAVPLTGTAIAISTILSGIATIAVLELYQKQSSPLPDSKRSLEKSSPFRGIRGGLKGLSLILSSLAGLFATDLAAEFMDLPNTLEDVFLDLAHNPLGILALAVVAPVVEEYVFRRGMISPFLAPQSHNLTSLQLFAPILISALTFGIIHGNPAQIPFAAIAGIILGYIYVQTRSILLTSVIHIINNSLAVLQYLLLGSEANQFSLREHIGTPASLVLILLLATVCVWGLHRNSKIYA